MRKNFNGPASCSLVIEHRLVTWRLASSWGWVCFTLLLVHSSSKDWLWASSCRCRIYVVFFRKDVYSKEDVRKCKYYVEVRWGCGKYKYGIWLGWVEDSRHMFNVQLYAGVLKWPLNIFQAHSIIFYYSVLHILILYESSSYIFQCWNNVTHCCAVL